ncbi:aminotransferase class I/II-fold pyridoxal phosphate-dependent enzyme [Paenibacillus senegalimassiliensis]|uniref:aminotransferase class I/II-fold pyridoxal phosphate-dependent enzyme n=1 Tax=Paenibacillus senegalimassiliensis TaxID=1737426 RepID=UPI00073F82EB|nr:aminotransferase class I/II-fold pyridoxal phosphate-dependent enzyme [Paenibacillus senegalimassiliensis]
MDPGLKLLKSSLPHHFAQELEGRYRKGTLISLAGSQGDGGGGTTEQTLKSAGEEVAEGEAWLNWLAGAYSQAEGGGTSPKQLLLADYADEALSLVLKAMVPEGGTVLVETPTSPEALEMIRQQGLQAVPVACDRDGMLPDDLRSKCERAGRMPDLIYVTPHYSNPSGRVWSRERKLELLQLSGQFGLPVVEDDTAGAVLFAEGSGEGSLGEARACRQRGAGQTSEPGEAGRSLPSLYRLRQRSRRRAVPVAAPARRDHQRSAAARFAAGRHSVPAGDAVLRERAG